MVKQPWPPAGRRRVEGQNRRGACVFLSSIIIALFYREFYSLPEFIAAQLVVPITMTVVEATAPHSMDTPALMLFGFSALYAVIVFA